MNIKEAKEQIIYTVQTYLTRNRQGQYAIPLPRQRPLCLMGPPGIGKTAIVEQVAQELGIGLVAYSMTHHTRQSAIGLPVILEKSYGGKACRVSEYTMSEIIASVYDMMEETGRKEGILFLDEINCVSETLAPSMLQFLQYKVFGRHPIPQGWVVVTAGNPPEYNHSARDFDMVTWDRLRRIDVEPDFRVWKEYGRQQGLHPAIMTYLETRWNDFYRVEATVEGKRFVTPRGWADLSESIVLYEQRGLPVDATLVAQYLQDPQTAQTFALYYDLFCKYQSHYQVEKILEGKAPADIRQRAAEAPFDERLALIGLLLDGVFASLREQAARERLPPLLLGQLKEKYGRDFVITGREDLHNYGALAGATYRCEAAPADKPEQVFTALVSQSRYRKVIDDYAIWFYKEEAEAPVLAFCKEFDYVLDQRVSLEMPETSVTWTGEDSLKFFLNNSGAYVKIVLRLEDGKDVDFYAAQIQDFLSRVKEDVEIMMKVGAPRTEEELAEERAKREAEEKANDPDSEVLP